MQTSLEHLNLRDSGLGSEGVAAILSMFSAELQFKFVSLHYLDLSGGNSTYCRIATAFQAVQLATVVVAHHDFVLVGNDIDEDLCEKVSEALKQLPGLSVLLLDDNELGGEGASILVDGLKALAGLSKLSCCSCEITAGGAFRIARYTFYQIFVAFWMANHNYCHAGSYPRSPHLRTWRSTEIRLWSEDSMKYDLCLAETARF